MVKKAKDKNLDIDSNNDTSKQNDAVDIHGKKFNRLAFVLVILIATFAGMLMQTSLGTAIPTLMKDFNINLATAQQATSWFLLANGIMVPVSAYLATKFSTKWLYVVAYVILFGSMIMAYTAPTTNWTWFLFSRVMQAIAVGITMPLMQVVMVYLFPPENRGAAMGLGGLVVGLAPAIGPTLSGWILDKDHNFFGLFTLTNSWRSIFLLPMIVVGISLLLAFVFLKDVVPNEKVKLDIRSLIQSTIGFGLFLWALTNVSNPKYNGWLDTNYVLIPGIVGLLFIITFVWHQLTMKNPFLDVRVFKNKQFAVTTILVSLSMMAMMGIEMMLPTYLQQIRGLSPFQSGLTLLPGAIMMGVMSPITGSIYDKVGAKRLAILGFLIVAIGTVPFYFLTADTPKDFITIMYSLRMFGIAMVMMPLTASAMSTLPPHESAHGTAANNTARQLASAIVVSLLTSVTQNIINTNKPSNSLKETNILKYAQKMIDASLDGFHASFLIALAFAVLGFLVAFMLRNGKKIESDSNVDDVPMSENTVETKGGQA
ncbi:MAG: multidrug efflux MFS transporter [Lactobacillaceae bacterium]|jgi:EmrB/QacA subfamily drug resistance transporter|nr:multidrug efflux MFS transporter [Lactobacillaceae bacterium]